MVIAWASDRARHRFVFAIIPICISITGFGMLLGLYPHTNAEYAALFLITAGTYSAMPIIVCWFTMNLGGHHRRAVGTGWQIGFGNIGGIIAVRGSLCGIRGWLLTRIVIHLPDQGLASLCSRL